MTPTLVTLFGVSGAGFLAALAQLRTTNSKMKEYGDAADQYVRMRLEQLSSSGSRDDLFRLLKDPSIKLALTDPRPREYRYSASWFAASGIVSLALAAAEVITGATVPGIGWVQLLIMGGIAVGLLYFATDVRFYNRLEKLLRNAGRPHEQATKTP